MQMAPVITESFDAYNNDMNHKKCVHPSCRFHRHVEFMPRSIYDILTLPRHYIAWDLS